jgi:hypothetical protein
MTRSGCVDASSYGACFVTAPPRAYGGRPGPLDSRRRPGHLGCASRAQPFWHFYPIHYQNWHTVFDTTLRERANLLDGSYGLHLWNEMTRRQPGFDRDGRFPGRLAVRAAVDALRHQR